MIKRILFVSTIIPLAIIFVLEGSVRAVIDGLQWLVIGKNKDLMMSNYTYNLMIKLFPDQLK